MLFRWEKHGAPVRRDFSHMMQKGRGRIGFCHGRCFRAQFALKGAHASPSLLAHAAGRVWGPAKTPRAASCLLMGSRPQWPPFGAKPRNCKYSYGVSPGFPPGSFYPRATQRSSARDDDTMYAFICTKYHTGLQLSMPFFLPAAFSRCPPKNPHREEPPPAPGAEGGVRVLARTRLERK